MWLETLWWYIHLAWKNDEKTTSEILKGNTTDTILNIIDRTGTYGYRRDLFNEILYKKRPIVFRTIDSIIFLNYLTFRPFFQTP